MDQFLEKDFEDLRGLFKREVKITNNNLNAILDLPADMLQGIDAVSKEKLEEARIKTVYDLSQAVLEEVKDKVKLDPSVLKKWIRRASIIVNYIQNPLTKRKMLLVGLDYAGKSSLLAVLKKDYSAIQDLLPTKGAQRDGVEFFSIPIITWDLGGQALYRKDYLDEKKSKLFFSETDVVFFVIDIQDTERYDEALEYYKQMLASYKNLGEEPAVIVLFNKMDPDLENKEAFMQGIATLQLHVADISTSFEFTPVFANTSIFDKNGVLQAFSLGIRNISQTALLVTTLLEEYVVKTNARAAVLLSSEGEVFAQTGITREAIELATHNGLLVDTMIKFDVGKGLALEKNPVIKFTDNELYLIGHQISQGPGRTVYMWVLIQNLVDFTSTLAYFKHEVEPLLSLFII